MTPTMTQSIDCIVGATFTEIYEVPSPTPTPTPTVTATPTNTVTPTPTPSINTSPTPTISVTPSITPIPTSSSFPTVPNYSGQLTITQSICLASDPAFVSVYYRNYDGHSDKLNWLNIKNATENSYRNSNELHVKQIYNVAGQQLLQRYGGVNNDDYARIDLSYYTGTIIPGNMYFVKYDVYCISDTHCGCTGSTLALYEEVSQFVVYNLGVGDSTSSLVKFSTNTSGEYACYPFNETKEIYYNIAQTNISSGAPLSVGSTIYTNSMKTVTAPAGAYVMRNNNKYIVNSSGVVTSIETNACTTPPTFSLEFKKPTFGPFLIGNSQFPLVVGNSYNLYNGDCAVATLRGTVQSKTGTAGNIMITLTNWTFYCDN